MKLVSRYLVRHIFIGFLAAAALLVPLFTLFDFISELEDVSARGYHWTQALAVVLMRVPRVIVNLSPFIALLGGIVGLGQLSASQEMTAIRMAGYSVTRIALAALSAGAIFTASLAAVDEWVASPLQQRAQTLKNRALANGLNGEASQGALWARRDNEFVRVKSVDTQGQPEGIEIFYYNADFSLRSYVYAGTATLAEGATWILHHARRKEWSGGKESMVTQPVLPWQSLFPGNNLQTLSLPTDSFTVSQLRQYIAWLQHTAQPAAQYQIALWQKPARPLLLLAMILLALPFTFGHPRTPGMGSRLSLGVIVGLLTWIFVQIVINLGLLLAFNPALTALGPSLLMLIVALLLVARVNRKP
ncbi:LPS export ABC transporter permease LptG [Erwinia sp. B116]|uniref:LPS export ABC transporter permease LptG n=1 Tax=Erwinia sp. B116 TaxID=1561024 RepID=UPI000C7802B4|nr:LPS export ABC transporter permease LptG [Erwinia sp. B116]PLV57753.1 permease [Erwinia sp. B116]